MIGNIVDILNTWPSIRDLVGEVTKEASGLLRGRKSNGDKHQWVWTQKLKSGLAVWQCAACLRTTSYPKDRVDKCAGLPHAFGGCFGVLRGIASGVPLGPTAFLKHTARFARGMQHHRTLDF